MGKSIRSFRNYRVRGVDRFIGTVKIPSAKVTRAFLARGMFHDLITGMPPAPDSVDFITPAAAALATMLGNGPDSTLPAGQGPVGDCVVAEDLHLAAMRACNAGSPWVPTTAQALAEYSAVTGFVIGDASTDQGTDPLALANYREEGNPYPDGSTILQAIAVDATNQASMKQALWLCDGLLMWASLPDEWESEEDGGDVWDVAGDPDPDNGHGFGGASYNASGILITTWGIDAPPISLTWAAAAKYLVPSAGGGAVAFVGSNIIEAATKKCPAGYDLSTLENFVASLGSPVTPVSGPPSSGSQSA